MKNIHILPTNKPSRLGRFIDTNNLSLRTTDDIPRGENINIYITNDEEIKEGDWMYYKHFGEDIVCKYDTINGQNTNVNEHKPFYQKIILTTDQDLIKDGVQAIDDKFLEWFVKNPSCEKVEVQKDKCLDTSLMCDCVDEPCRNKGYKIVISKEEPKQEEDEIIDISDHDGIGNAVDNLNNEPPQETLEEAAENYAKQFDWAEDSSPQLDFIEGAKWQAERSYSEEDIIRFAEFVAIHPDKNKNVYGEMLHAKSKYDDSEKTIDLLEQFKKK